MAGDMGTTELEVRQSEFSYLATLESPVFDVLCRGGQLYGAIFAGLNRFGVKLQDLKVESASLNPADISVACYLLDRGSVIRYRLDRVEVWSTHLRVGGESLGRLIEDAVRVLRDASQAARVGTHTLSLGIHGLLVNTTIEAWLAGYVSKTPRGAFSFNPSGVSFSCEWPGAEGESSVVLERSLTVPIGVSFRGTSVHPGRLSELEVFQRATDFFEKATASLGIKLKGGP